jgi:phosphoribosylformylglycinamidine synthase
MVGPWQVPVADVAVTASDYRGYQGEALAMGERAPVALLNSAAAARLAVGEAITNIAAAAIPAIESIALSANWMAAPDAPGQSVGLYEAVEAIGLSFCPDLGISIPVGKDSLSMQAEWKACDGESNRVTSPVSLVISAAAPVRDIRATLTPELKTTAGETELLCFDLGLGSGALGGSVLAQVQGVTGDEAPDAPPPAILKSFFQLIQTLNAQGDLLAYHDRSDGGLLATLTEMMFAGQVGVTVCLEALHACPITAACVETLGAVVQVRSADRVRIQALADECQLGALTHWIGCLNQTDTLRIEAADGTVHYEAERLKLRSFWSELSYRMQALRDHPDCAKSAFDAVIAPKRPGISADLTFDLDEDIAAPYYQRNVRPRIAILREQGVNGHMEMAAAFDTVGFESVDVTMSDLLAQRADLSDYQGLAACGGFSYGDVLGAGRGWATAIRMNPMLHAMFSAFFTRNDTFTLGVCNGCQMLSHLADLIPGAAGWPRFVRNESEQFEARLSLVQVTDSPSIFFAGMQGAVLPVPVAHGEGRVCLPKSAAADKTTLASLRYVDTHHQVTTTYPDNPNGSPEGLTAMTSHDGRATIMMPHPERVFRAAQFSTYPAAWGERSPWQRFFANARVFVE